MWTEASGYFGFDDIKNTFIMANDVKKKFQQMIFLGNKISSKWQGNFI